MPVSARAPFILLGILALQPLPYVAALTWEEYARLLVVTVGMGYLMWRYGRAREERPQVGASMMAVLTALAFVFLLNQFDRGVLPVGPVWHLAMPFWVPSLLVVGALAFSMWNRQPGRSAGWSDWVAVAVAAIFVGVSVGAALISGQDVPWGIPGKILISLLLWFAVTRTHVSFPEAGRKLAAGLLAVLALVSLVGLVQLAGVFVFSYRGDLAYEEGDLPAAAARYQRALALSAKLKLDRVEESVAFDLAGVLFAQGKQDQAAKTLSMEKGFITVVPAAAWDGPEGGNLYYLTHCWKDVTLYAGEVEIRIYAHGTPALDVWPLMQVTLGDRKLGDIFVETADPKAYSFLVDIEEKTRARLTVSFLNDFHQTAPYMDRNLKIEQAEIQYRHIAWK